MSGLILQDILAMKKVIRTYVLVLAFYIVLGLMNRQASQFSVFFIFFSVFLSMSAFAFREKNKWDMNAAVMPVARNEMIKATYLMAYIFQIIAVVCVLALNVIDVFGKKMSSKESIEMFGVTGVISLVGIMYIAFMLPILFQFGMEKGRLIVTGCFVIPIAAFMFAEKLGVDLNSIALFIEQRAEVLPLLLGVIAILMSVVSYMISVKIYEKKEF